MKVFLVLSVLKITHWQILILILPYNLSCYNGLFQLSWADLYFIAWSETIPMMCPGLDLEAKYPCFKVLKERVQTNPNIQAYIRRRPAWTLSYI